MTAITDIQQRDSALRRANVVRMTTADFKRELARLSNREAILEVARVVLEESERIGPLKVHVVLELAPKMGPVKVRRVLQRNQVWPLRQLRSLTERQRGILSGELVVHAASLESRS